MSIDNDYQFKKMEEIGLIVANCLEYLKAKSVVGISTKELDHLAGNYLTQYGALSAPKSVYNFPGNVCISVEHEVAHGIPSDLILGEGDLINIDVSASKDGFFADNGESFVVGNASKEKKQLCIHVQTALSLALDAARAGSKINRIGLAVENYARRQKISVIRDLGGHGVGLGLHEAPEFIGSFCDPRDKRILKANTVIAIEPFLSNGASHVEESDDGWTLYHHNFYSVQKEHTLMVRKGAPHIFTKPSKRFCA